MAAVIHRARVVSEWTLDHLDTQDFVVRAMPLSEPKAASASTSYSISPGSVTVNENAGTVTFTITRSGSLPAESLFVSTVQGSSNGFSANNGDYTGKLNETLSFSANQTSRTVTVSITDDTSVESDETFGLILQRNSSDPVSTYLARSTFTIHDNDAVAPTTYGVSPGSVTVDEGAGTVTFTVTRSGGLPAETVYVSTVQGSSNGFAANSGDYTGKTGEGLTFSSGQVSKTFTISITNDTAVESDETFGVVVQRNASDPVSTYLARSTFTIHDNDAVAPTSYSVSPGSVTVDEGAGTVTFTVNRSGGLPAETVYVSTVQGSSNGFAANSGDYTGKTGEGLTFSSGQTSKTFTISITNDTVVESDETFGVVVQRNASDPVSTYLARSTFTIHDNDVGPVQGNTMAAASLNFMKSGISAAEVVDIARANNHTSWGDQDCTDFVWAVTNLAGARFFDSRDHTLGGNSLRINNDAYVVPHSWSHGAANPWMPVAINASYGTTLDEKELALILKPGDVVRAYNDGSSERHGHSFIVTGYTYDTKGQAHVMVIDNVDGIVGNPSTNTILEHDIHMIYSYVKDPSHLYIYRLQSGSGMVVETKSDPISEEAGAVTWSDLGRVEHHSGWLLG
jgi:hypothetical protein